METRSTDLYMTKAEDSCHSQVTKHWRGHIELRREKSKPTCLSRESQRKANIIRSVEFQLGFWLNSLVQLLKKREVERVELQVLNKDIPLLSCFHPLLCPEPVGDMQVMLWKNCLGEAPVRDARQSIETSGTEWGNWVKSDELPSKKIFCHAHESEPTHPIESQMTTRLAQWHSQSIVLERCRTSHGAWWSLPYLQL